MSPNNMIIPPLSSLFFFSMFLFLRSFLLLSVSLWKSKALSNLLSKHECFIFLLATNHTPLFLKVLDSFPDNQSPPPKKTS